MRARWIGIGVAAVIAAGATDVGVASLADGDEPAADGTIPDCVRGEAEASDPAVTEWVTDDGVSIARAWNEAALAAIRSDFPAPTVHSRNLYHSSAAMWDAWAAYDPSAQGVFVDEDHVAEDVTAARESAMSFAAYRILVERYLRSPDAETAVTRLDDLMAGLCYDPEVTTVEGDTPVALGNRIGAAVLEATIDDGSNESDDYAVTDYTPVNQPLVVADPGTEMDDPDRWQPLELTRMVAQNGIPLDETVQTFVGPQWGSVTPFALPADDEPWEAVDPGPPPALGDPDTNLAFKQSANEVIRFSSMLDPTDGEVIDSSPNAMGDVVLGTYDARGRTTNPVTGEPYEHDVVRRGDYGRVIAEFWADGPNSETPPGHWNTLANYAGDQLEVDGSLRIGGDGPEIDRLEWDTKLYLALNGATHDAAIAGWGTKGYYDSSRPISMIRYMGGLGQSSDQDGPSYDPDGLLLERGLVEVVTEESSAPGERHESLADHVGEIAILAWQGAPADSETEIGGVGWIRAVEWVPYQRSTFVTPAFAGYVSGHSTFSRASAEVLTEITGSEYFPGGLGTATTAAGELEFEDGPFEDVVLQWATYRDAADQAGISRLYGGIHVRADDLEGRKIGERVGQDAWALAQRYYDGSAG